MNKDQIKKELHQIDCRVGGQIRERRLYMKLSQEKLADELGVTFQQLQKYENATNRVAASRLYRLHQIMKVPLAYFFSPSLCETAGLGEAYRYDPDLVKWVQLYPRLPENMRQSLTKIIEAVNNA